MYKLLKWNHALPNNEGESSQKSGSVSRKRNVKDLNDRDNKHPSLRDRRLKKFGSHLVPKVNPETYYKKFRARFIKSNWVEWICIVKREREPVHKQKQINIEDQSIHSSSMVRSR